MVKCSCGSTYFSISGKFTIEGTAFHCHEHIIMCCSCGTLYNIKGDEVTLPKKTDLQNE